MLPETKVHFCTQDETLQRVYDKAEEKCLQNITDFAGEKVLVEGGGYEKIWLETQPMGGEMYALRNLQIALNNNRMFMRYQREDGRLPGSIACENGRVIPQFNKYQGFCFSFHALNLYYMIGRDADYLNQLKETLIRFDACLWRTRSLREDGLLRSFCVYDTGEDLALRYGDAPCWWTEDPPPEGYQVVPMASMDVTSWSYACRNTLSKIFLLEQQPEIAENWAKKAEEVRFSLKRELWDAQAGALYDRDHAGNRVNVLCHNTLRCMYWGSLDQEMADRFVQRQLLNPSGFNTPFPLPSVAVSDPSFRNAPENNWSGQSEGLTYQRAILALERYGYPELVTALGEKLIAAIAGHGYRFTQQFDPFTGTPSLVHAVTHQPVSPESGEPVQDAYGPTLLAVLEYIAHHYGIDTHLGEVWFSLGSGKPYEYEAAFAGHTCGIFSDGKKAEIRMDRRMLGSFPCGSRIVTDENGNIRRTVRIEGVER